MTAQDCPGIVPFDEYRGQPPAGIHRVAGEKLLVHLGEGDEWFNWVGPSCVADGTELALFDAWRSRGVVSRWAIRWRTCRDQCAPL